SAAISVALAKELGVKIVPSQLQVTTAAQGSPLEVAGTVDSLLMGIAPTTFLRLRDVVVYRNLSHPLNLGLHFCRKFKAKVCYKGDQPYIEIRETRYQLVDSPASGPRDQRRDQQPAQARRNLDRHYNRQISTSVNSYNKTRVKVEPRISITTMSMGLGEGSCGRRKNETIMEM
ncbi:MAG: hypothetical protein GY696_19135, partial [Gammaproteobacteria bacterium]|nr:hypothetical protein [Gammaproteobacteria bacterium]